MRYETYRHQGSLSDCRNWFFVTTEPFLKNHQTKQDLVIIVSPGNMLFEKFAHDSRAKVLKDSRTAVKKGISHFVVHGASEPLIYNIYSKSSFWPFQNRGRKVAPADLIVQPFLGSIPHFQVCGQSLDIFDDIFVQIRDTKFKTVRHRELVRIHKEFVGKAGSHLEELQPTKLVRLGHQIRHAIPALEYGVTRVGIEYSFLE